LAKGDEFFQVWPFVPADRRLHFRYLKIVTPVRIGVLVIISSWKGSKLPFESSTARVVVTRGAKTVSTPVAKGFKDPLQWSCICSDGSPLPHGNMVSRVEGERGDIAERAYKRSFGAA